MVVASFKSVGIAIAPAMTLKRIYHCVPSNINTIAASDRWPGKAIRSGNNAGKKAVAGIEATTCTTGCSTLDQRGDTPIATPTGTVQAAPTSNAVNVRSQVAPAASNNMPQVASGTCVSNSSIRQSAYRTPARNTSSSRRCNQGLTLTLPVFRFSAYIPGAGNGCRRFKTTAIAVPSGRNNRRLSAATRVERRKRFNTGEPGGSPSLFCSSLNLSAHATNGRQKKKSSRTIKAINVVRPSKSAPVLPSFAATCRYDPNPGNWKEWFPSTNCSEAIRKNQPPAQLIILFQINPIMADGTSSLKNRCQGRRRAIAANSFNSVGKTLAEW